MFIKKKHPKCKREIKVSKVQIAWLIGCDCKCFHLMTLQVYSMYAKAY